MQDESSPAPSWSGASVPIFVVSIFASAFLIFLVQPMVGKRILPWFGGTAAVWMVCLAFYQTALFLGYAYAHLLIRWATPARQLLIHSILVAIALLLMPVLPGDHWKPAGVSSPISDIVSMLMANVAIPFLILASTGPLVQAWFARLHPTRSPYPLYAVSNGGSFLALLAYPILLEPRLGLATTGNLWSFAFGATTLLVLTCAFLTWRGGPRPVAAVASDGVDKEAGAAPPGGMRVLLWLLLSAGAVMVLMGVTNRLCRDVASVPFLWIVPLSIYLLTLILSFASERVFQRGILIAVGLVSLLATLGQSLWRGWEFAQPLVALLSASLPAQITAYGLLLFAMGMLMHGELYRLRPAPSHLTSFYLMVAGGGALGGLFVGLVAPSIFDEYHELAVGLAMSWLLIPLTLAYERSASGIESRGRLAGALLAIPALFVVAQSVRIAPAEVIYQERTFFGTVHVADVTFGGEPQRRLYHGQTLHGLQLAGPYGARTPTEYFGRATPIGLLLNSRPRGQESRVGIIGLGAGTLASYGREGDLFRFYEIDPIVVEIASEGGLFRFLESSRAEIETVIGDGRLALEQEPLAGVEQDFDILILDAFSSDSVPVHLLTREAFATYRAALEPDGLIMLHLSNRHLELLPLAARQGTDSGFGVLLVTNQVAPKHRSAPSQWALLVPETRSLDEVTERMRGSWAKLGLPPLRLEIEVKRASDGVDDALAVWTDDYSDLASIVILPESGAEATRRGSRH